MEITDILELIQLWSGERNIKNYSLLANYREANRAPSPVELARADPDAMHFLMRL